MFDNPTDNHTDIEVPLYYKLRFTKLKNDRLIREILNRFHAFIHVFIHNPFFANNFSSISYKVITLYCYIP